MSAVSARARAVLPSPTVAMSRRARELCAQGRDLVDLTVGEPGFRPPEAVLEAAARAVREGADRYTPVAGLPELREAAAALLGTSPDRVLVSAGAKNCLALAMLALLDPGDEVLVPIPSWSSYLEMARLADALPRELRTRAENGYKLSPEELEAAISPRTRLLVLCSPGNPTGSAYTREELLALVGVLERHPRVFVLSDEVYGRLSYKGRLPSPRGLPGMEERVIVADGLSKSHAMTGWRIGFLTGPRNLVDAAETLQGQTLTCAAAISQKAAVAALSGDQRPYAAMVEAYRARRDRALSVLGSLPGLRTACPDGAFYLFPEASGLRNRAGGKLAEPGGLEEFFLEEAGVALVAGTAFGEPGSFRLSFAADDATLDKGLDRLAKAIQRLHEDSGRNRRTA